MKITVLIVAAGRGTRLGGEIPKQYREIGGQTVLAKTINCFADIPGIETIHVAIHKDDAALFDAVSQSVDQEISSVIGGATRTASVKAGLQALAKDNPDIVLIHDAARPFVSKQVIEDVISGLEEHTACVPVLSISDALKTTDGDAVDRGNLLRAQTPQGFRFEKIMQAYEKLPDHAAFADDIEVARKAGFSIGMCTGSDENIKLTYAKDFERTESSSTMINVTGSGYDVHRICEGETVWLCGVEIAAGFSLKGHSDADVGLHALTDAILGAISEGDIGDHFPPSDPKWKGAPSKTFLEFAANQVRIRNGVIDHIDVTLICEAPKIKPHREVMRSTIADIVGIPMKKISVKATTTEGLGFTGRGEGIAAQAIANIRLPYAE